MSKKEVKYVPTIRFFILIISLCIYISLIVTTIIFINKNIKGANIPLFLLVICSSLLLTWLIMVLFLIKNYRVCFPLFKRRITVLEKYRMYEDLNNDGVIDKTDKILYLERQKALARGYERGVRRINENILVCPFCEYENAGTDKYCGGCGCPIDRSLKRKK